MYHFSNTHSIFHKKQIKKKTSHVSYFSQICTSFVSYFFLNFSISLLNFLSFFLVSIEIYDKKVFIYKKSLNCDGKLLALRLFKGSYQKFKNFALESKIFVSNFFSKTTRSCFLFSSKRWLAFLIPVSYKTYCV